MCSGRESVSEVHTKQFGFINLIDAAARQWCWVRKCMLFGLRNITVGCVAQLVERRSLTGELSLSCARPAADGSPLMWVIRPL